MKTKTNSQEVLLMTNTTFSKRQLLETNESHSNDYSEPVEQLEVACCNGLLYEMLPEIMPATSSAEKLFLWAIIAKRSFLRILTGTEPVYIANRCSIDPHIFLANYKMS
jgi:hypothetical protein